MWVKLVDYDSELIILTFKFKLSLFRKTDYGLDWIVFKNKNKSLKGNKNEWSLKITPENQIKLKRETIGLEGYHN